MSAGVKWDGKLQLYGKAFEQRIGKGGEGLLLTRTSLSPNSGMGAFSLSFKLSKPFWPSTVHCLACEGGAIVMKSELCGDDW